MMQKLWNHGIEKAGGAVVVRRWALALAAGAMLWFRPSNSISEAVLWLAGLYALWNWRTTLTAWKNPAGLCFGVGIVWAAASVLWSFYPAGTAQDLSVGLPLVISTLAISMIFDRPSRIWAALVTSAGLITLRLAWDLIRLWSELGWPTVMTEARFFHPYVYTHPNVSSMMAGLCILVFIARWVAGANGCWRKVALAAGMALNLVYLVVLASRGPQIVFALGLLIFPIVLLPGWRSRLVALLLVSTLGFGLFKMAIVVNPRFQDRTMTNFNSRDTVWGHSKLLADRKPVLGYGFGKQAFEKAVYDNPDQRPPLVPFHFPHAHQYWLMLYFQGGIIGFALWSLGWLALLVRLARTAIRRERLAVDGRGRVQARVLPALLGMGILYILIYGLGDFPDHVIRRSLFYLAGLTMALTLPPTPSKEASQ